MLTVSRACPKVCWYSCKVVRNWAALRVVKTWMKVSSLVPKRAAPALYSSWASANASSWFSPSDSDDRFPLTRANSSYTTNPCLQGTTQHVSKSSFQNSFQEIHYKKKLAESDYLTYNPQAPRIWFSLWSSSCNRIWHSFQISSSNMRIWFII